MIDRRLYWVWCDMRYRCRNPRHKAYKNYGGRGISVCDRWDSFELFTSDMGNRPKGMTLERVDNNAGYSPGNCRWASRQEQAINKRDYKNNSSGYKNIVKEVRSVRGNVYEYWRVRVRRNGKILSHKRFKNIHDAVAHRDFEECSHE